MESNHNDSLTNNAENNLQLKQWQKPTIEKLLLKSATQGGALIQLIEIPLVSRAPS